MYIEKIKNADGTHTVAVSGLGSYSLADTLECGQIFSHTPVPAADGGTDYLIPIGTILITVGQRRPGELLFRDISDRDLEEVAVPFFALATDFSAIADSLAAACPSPWFRTAADGARGVAILKQDAWETLFSFIVSQNNNIPRIKKIIRRLRVEYGENLALASPRPRCPLSPECAAPCEEKCKNCGACYSFPTARAVTDAPEKLLSANPGFRYRYLCDAARRVTSGETDLAAIEAVHSCEHSVTELKKIVGVGDKVASCTALFGLGNLDAFPIDVWMKRAIDKYFDGNLDPAVFGKYAGVAQQYIFHYIRNLEKT